MNAAALLLRLLTESSICNVVVVIAGALLRWHAGRSEYGASSKCLGHYWLKRLYFTVRQASNSVIPASDCFALLTAEQLLTWGSFQDVIAPGILRCVSIPRSMHSMHWRTVEWDELMSSIAASPR
jgi:hypothetical protein